MSDEKLLTEAEAAKYLGYTLRGIQQLRYAGKCPRYVQARKGGIVTYRMSDIKEWVEANSHDPK